MVNEILEANILNVTLEYELSRLEYGVPFLYGLISKKKKKIREVIVLDQSFCLRMSN